jgi:membrane-bound ClpP family serine protease
MGATNKNTGQWLFGLIILIIGIIFLLENIFGFKVWESVWLFWPVIFILWGIVEIFQKKSIFFGIILLAIGVIFIAKNFDLYLISESIWKFWPVIIIAVGIDQIFKRTEVSHFKVNRKNRKGGKETVIQDDEII